MNDIILIPFSKHEFRSFVKACVNEAIEESALNPIANFTDQILSIKEASSFLNLAQQTLYGFTSKRVIPFFKRGKKLYFKKSELENWLIEGRRKSKGEILKEMRDK